MAIAQCKLGYRETEVTPLKPITAVLKICKTMVFRRYSKSLCMFITVFILFYTMYLVIDMDPLCMNDMMPLNSFLQYDGTGNETQNLTVVTAYFNLGSFIKGSRDNVFGPRKYRKWASVYRYMHNPVVLYTDSDDFGLMFASIRGHLGPRMTKVVRVERRELWAFRLLNRTREIYADPTYPKFYPNTVLAEYSCSQNAKYACVEDAVAKRHVRTPYAMWLDVGFFRHITERRRHFRMTLPAGFDRSRIAVNQMQHRTLTETPEEIFRADKVWVGGGVLVGRAPLLVLFARAYRAAVVRYLDMSLSNTDQQVLFAMFTRRERELRSPPVDLQLYVWDVFGSCWYYLGFQCYHELR